MKFRETTQEDIDYVANHSVSQGILNKQPEQIDFCYTLEHEDKVLGIGGIRLITPTTAWAWIDMASDAGSHIVTVYRVIKEWMDILAKEKGIKRLQAYIDPEFPEAIRMIMHLGFEQESTMKAFLPDGAAYLYRRLF